MAFTQNTFASVGAHSANTPNLYSYKSGDALSIVITPDYFLVKKEQLGEGDFMLVQLSDFSGFLEVNETTSGVKIVTDPLQKTAFGDTAVTEGTPVVRVSSQYGITDSVNTFNSGGGTATGENQLYKVTSGTSAFGFGSITSKDFVTYRAGQGMKDLFTARFTAGAVGNDQASGMANSNCGVQFGYNGAVFGTLFSHGGAIGIQDLTITTPASGSENATITVNGTAFTVPLTAGTVQHNADEIAISLNAQDSFFQYFANDDEVRADSLFSAPASLTFAFSSSTAVAAWAQVALGAAIINDWTRQEKWSENKFNSLDPADLNSYKILYGPDTVEYFIHSGTGTEYTLVHVVNNNNEGAALVMTNPSFRHTWFTFNIGANTTNITTEGSYGYISREGKETILAPIQSIEKSALSVGTTPVPVITVRNRGSIGDVINLANIVLNSIRISSDTTKPIILTAIRNATLTDPVFEFIDKTTSITEIDTSATAFTGGETVSTSGVSVVIASGSQENIRRTETLTIAVSVSASPSSDFEVAIAFKEDK